MIKLSLPPNGPKATKFLPVEFDQCTLWTDTKTQSGDFNEGIGARLDWYNDALQVCIDDSHEDVALHIRFNRDGTIAEILVRDDVLFSKVIVEPFSNKTTPWQQARDGE